MDSSICKTNNERRLPSRWQSRVSGGLLKPVIMFKTDTHLFPLSVMKAQWIFYSHRKCLRPSFHSVARKRRKIEKWTKNSLNTCVGWWWHREASHARRRSNLTFPKSASSNWRVKISLYKSTFHYWKCVDNSFVWMMNEDLVFFRLTAKPDLCFVFI